MQTDNGGYAIFKNLSILRGPIGTYEFSFYTYITGQSFSSDGYNMIITSNVTTLKVIVPPPFKYDLTGDPSSISNRFQSQPIVRVLDFLGQPVSGKYVIAFTWPEPIFGGWGSTYNLQGIETFNLILK